MCCQKISDVDVRELHQRYAGGERLVLLAAERGVSGEALRKRFHRLGLALGLPHRPARTGRRTRIGRDQSVATA